MLAVFILVAGLISKHSTDIIRVITPTQNCMLCVPGYCFDKGVGTISTLGGELFLRKYNFISPF